MRPRVWARPSAGRTTAPRACAARSHACAPKPRWQRSPPPPPRNSCAALFENDGLVSVGQEAVFEVQPNGAREDDFFEVAALADQVLYRIAVRDARHVLLDDGALV